MTEEKMYHLGFGRGDLAPQQPTSALLCGDPQRTRRIAEQTPGVRCEKVLSENRGLNSYLCRLESGRWFVSATSGMGAPSLSIVVNELVSVGITEIVRVGTCGSIREGIEVGSVVISQAALCRQGAALDIAPPEYPAAADPFVTVSLVEAARELGVDWHLGVTASVDTFYEGQERTASSANPHLQRSLQGITEEYRRLNVLNYEMEAGTLFKMGLAYGFAAGCVCGVLAERCGGEEVVRARKETAERDAARVALGALEKMAAGS